MNFNNAINEFNIKDYSDFISAIDSVQAFQSVISCYCKLEKDCFS